MYLCCFVLLLNFLWFSVESCGGGSRLVERSMDCKPFGMIICIVILIFFSLLSRSGGRVGRPNGYWMNASAGLSKDSLRVKPTRQVNGKKIGEIFGNLSESERCAGVDKCVRLMVCNLFGL